MQIFHMFTIHIFGQEISIYCTINYPVSPLLKMVNEAPSSRMLICLWKGCKRVFENTDAFQEHVAKHGQQLNCTNPDDDTMEQEEPLAKKARMDEDKDEIANQPEINENKIVFLAIEVWVDVLGFIRRIQLSRTICLTNRRFHQICWPRLHGDKVNMHEVREITIIRRERFDRDRPPKALMLINDKTMSLPICPPPPYISGFGKIKINILDEQVFDFLKQILPCIVAHRIKLLLCSNKPDLKQSALLLDKLLDIFRGASNVHLELNCSIANIPLIPDLDNKMQTIKFLYIHEGDIPLLMKMLSFPRPDGQLRVICLPFQSNQFKQIMLDAIKMEFHAATQPLPQPFYIRTRIPRQNNNVERNAEKNAQTDETLIVSNRTMAQNWNLRCKIYRHPIGQHEKWVADANKRINLTHERTSTTIIEVALW